MPTKEQVQDSFDEWHLNYTGELTLEEYMAKHAGWSPMDYAEWEVTGNLPHGEA